MAELTRLAEMVEPQFDEGVMAGRRKITEKEDLQKEWYKRAKKMTLAELPEFMRELYEDYAHDYGTICHSIAASALAAAHAMDSGPFGGITGFQADAIEWQIINEWGALTTKDAPARMMDFSNMLYPQYEENFKSITAATWEWLQAEAKKNLEDRGHATNTVVAHWQSIVDGLVPFGMSVRPEPDREEAPCASTESD